LQLGNRQGKLLQIFSAQKEKYLRINWML